MSEMTMWPGISLKVDRPGQWVESGVPELDPDWRFVDAQGHGHFVDPKATSDDRLPTLTWVAQPCTMGHGDDCESEGDWTCSLCGEVISPGSRTAKPVFISGPTNYELAVQRGQMTFRYSGFGPDQLEAVAGAIADAVQATLGEFTVEVRHGP